MINPYFKEKFPFAYNYFSTLLELKKQNKRSFCQALVFEGTDTAGQYLFALELARNLNCHTQEENCLCTNCKWIKTYCHPAVNNVSQIHFKGEGDETKTMISTKQVLEIEKNLSLLSDYHRFFIFFSSQNKNLSEDKKREFEKLGYSSDIQYTIDPLDLKTFHYASPNALLKSIEEPPKNTTFVFLTNSRENILPTIVSRCQVFKLAGRKTSFNYDKITDILNKYPNIDYENAIDISSSLYEFIKNGNINLDELLNQILQYFSDLYKTNFSNKILNDINLTNNAIKMYKASMQDKIVLDTLFLQIARGY